MVAGRIALLQAMPIFGALSEAALDVLLENAPVVRREPGAPYCREGERAQCMYVIEHGTVEVVKRWQGRDWPLHRLHAGDCFGEMALMDFCARSASVLAVGPCSALEIDSAALQRLAERDIQQFALLQMNLGREISRRLRLTDELLFRLRQGAPVEPDEGPPTLV